MTPFMEQFIALGGQDVAKIPLVRRLWFECYSATMVDIQQRVSGQMEGASRKLTQPELTSRRKEMQSKVTGLKLEGELDVSDDLINSFAQMALSQVIKYVPLEKATKRELGIEGIASDPHIVKDGGLPEEVPAPSAAEAGTCSDSRVEFVVQRLGLAGGIGAS